MFVILSHLESRFYTLATNKINSNLFRLVRMPSVIGKGVNKCVNFDSIRLLIIFLMGGVHLNFQEFNVDSASSKAYS